MLQIRIIVGGLQSSNEQVHGANVQLDSLYPMKMGICLLFVNVN
jgi:hypothetical protein